MMNLEEYFQRIGCRGSCDKPDLATLQQIHKRHILAIPFENLSIHCGEMNTMNLEVIFDKIVRGHRGGWCMESNLLFGWVLREMGYDAATLSARVFNRSLGVFDCDETHLINKVTIDGKAYLTDVSFGDLFQLWEPMEFISGKDQPQPPGVFRLLDKGDMWVLEKTGRKPKVLDPQFEKSSLIDREGTRKVYCFTLEPRQINHFLEINRKLQSDPASLFVKLSICALQTTVGLKSLIGWTYSEVTYKPEEGVDVFDMRHITDEEMDHVLLSQFGIKLKNKLQPVHKESVPIN